MATRNSCPQRKRQRCHMRKTQFSLQRHNFMKLCIKTVQYICILQYTVTSISQNTNIIHRSNGRRKIKKTPLSKLRDVISHEKRKLREKKIGLNRKKKLNGVK